MSLEEEVDKCSRIHDSLAQYWNWAYYDTPYEGDCSWILEEYVKQIKPDVERRVPAMLSEMQELLKESPRDSLSILDVGCGVGGFIYRIMSRLSQEYPSVKLRASGIDISSEMIDCAKEHLRDFDVELICDSITNRDSKFKNEPFDVAVMMVTLSFYGNENAKKVLQSIHNRLKRDGCLLLMDFAWTYTWSGLHLFSKPLQRLADMLFSNLLGEPFRFRNRTEDQLKALLVESGFEVARSYLTERKSKMKGMLVLKAHSLTKDVATDKPNSEEFAISTLATDEQKPIMSRTARHVR
jgi:SAM-dependent methyltransferase